MLRLPEVGRDPVAEPVGPGAALVAAVDDGQQRNEDLCGQAVDEVGAWQANERQQAGQPPPHVRHDRVLEVGGEVVAPQVQRDAQRHLERGGGPVPARQVDDVDPQRHREKVKGVVPIGRDHVADERHEEEHEREVRARQEHEARDERVVEEREEDVPCERWKLERLGLQLPVHVPPAVLDEHGREVAREARIRDEAQGQQEQAAVQEHAPLHRASRPIARRQSRRSLANRTKNTLEPANRASR